MTLGNPAGGSIKFDNYDGNHGHQAFIEVIAPDSYNWLQTIAVEAAREETADFNFKQTNNGTLNTRFTIKGETGRVGIGTNNPSALLTVGADEGFKIPTGSATIVSKRNIAIQTVYPILQLLDTDSASDYQIQNANGDFDKDIINNPDIYAEMVQKSGQPLSPCVEINGQMLADVSGEEVEAWMVENGVVDSAAA